MFASVGFHAADSVGAHTSIPLSVNEHHIRHPIRSFSFHRTPHRRPLCTSLLSAHPTSSHHTFHISPHLTHPTSPSHQVTGRAVDVRGNTSAHHESAGGSSSPGTGQMISQLRHGLPAPVALEVLRSRVANARPLHMRSPVPEVSQPFSVISHFPVSSAGVPSAKRASEDFRLAPMAAGDFAWDTQWDDGHTDHIQPSCLRHQGHGWRAFCLPHSAAMNEGATRGKAAATHAAPTSPRCSFDMHSPATRRTAALKEAVSTETDLHSCAVGQALPRRRSQPSQPLLGDSGPRFKHR